MLCINFLYIFFCCLLSTRELSDGMAVNPYAKHDYKIYSIEEQQRKVLPERVGSIIWVKNIGRIMSKNG